MKRITLKSICVQNFKGCKEREIAFGNTTDIYGANASGKTTIADAFSWVLFDRDSTGAAKFDVRPLDASGRMVDNIDICVTAVLDVDGAEITLRKTQRQNWVKKRSSDAPKLRGNTNVYEINGFPASETEYKAKVSEIIPEELFKLLTDPRAFAAMPWKKQREILMEFVSGVTDADVAATNPEKYAPVIEDLLAAPVEKCLEKVKAALKTLKKTQDELPARIDQASKSLVEVPERSVLDERWKELHAQLDAVRTQREDAGTAYKAAADLQAEIMQAKLDIGGLEQAANEDLSKRRREAKRLYDEKQAEEFRLHDERERKEKELDRLRAQIADAKEAREELAEKWKAAKAMVLDESATICDKCGQVLPEDKIAEIKAGFEARRKASLDRINAEGQGRREEIDAAKERMTALEEEIADLKRQWNTAATETGKAYTAMKAIPDMVEVSEIPGYAQARERLGALEARLSTTDTGAEFKQKLAEREQGIREELDTINRQFAAIEFNAKTAGQIEELKAQQRTVGQQVADQEQKQYLLEEFVKAKMEMLSGEINAKFKIVRFKLFETQLNGGINPTCEMTVDGVPYSSLNSAGKLQAGLDVIGALQRLYDVTAPIWLDNRESVHEIPTMDAQIINLYVSPDDTQLRVEVEK